MSKTIITVSVICGGYSLQVQAQQGGESSPFTRFGIGDIVDEYLLILEGWEE